MLYSRPALLNAVLMRILISLLLLISLSATAQQEPLHVFVSVLPQKTFVEAIAGDQASVDVLVLPGQNPATYNPAPKQMQRFSKADILFRVGVPFEDAWLPRLLGTNQAIEVVDARDGIELLKLANHEHEEDDHQTVHNELDPHIWTSPAIARQMIKQITDVLSRKRPAQAAQFENRRVELDSELDKLDSEIRSLLAPYHGRTFMVFHPSWGYFANSYGLHQMAIEYNGKQPNAQRLSQQIKEAGSAGIPAIFVQPQFSIQTASAVATAINGKLLFIDPLAEDYMTNLRSVARKLAETFTIQPGERQPHHEH
jgi:zinc transport system substrate-binding protein